MGQQRPKEDTHPQVTMALPERTRKTNKSTTGERGRPRTYAARKDVRPPPSVAAPDPGGDRKKSGRRRPDRPRAARERALKPGDPFKECADCPEMIVVPAGRFALGSPTGQGDDSERPAHEVTIAKPFAAAKFKRTFDEWDACAAHGGCRSM